MQQERRFDRIEGQLRMVWMAIAFGGTLMALANWLLRNVILVQNGRVTANERRSRENSFRIGVALAILAPVMAIVLPVVSFVIIRALGGEGL